MRFRTDRMIGNRGDERRQDDHQSIKPQANYSAKLLFPVFVLMQFKALPKLSVQQKHTLIFGQSQQRSLIQDVTGAGLYFLEKVDVC